MKRLLRWLTKPAGLSLLGVLLLSLVVCLSISALQKRASRLPVPSKPAESA